MASVTSTPEAMPASATHRKVSAAFDSEKVPVRAAATAKRKHTRPLASLSRDSPSRMCIRRGGIGTRAAIEPTATGSVGARMAASAKDTANGSSGISQWIRKPAPTTVNSTRPSASSRITFLSRNSPTLGMRQPSRNSSGGRNRMKKVCGSSRTGCQPMLAIRTPSPIWTRGSGRAIGSTLTR